MVVDVGAWFSIIWVTSPRGILLRRHYNIKQSFVFAKCVPNINSEIYIITPKSTLPANRSANDLLFCLPGEHCSWTIRELFAELFAKTLFCPIWRTLFMNISQTVYLPNWSPNDIFPLPSEHCSWTSRVQFAEVFAKGHVKKSRRSLFMNADI